MTPEAKGSPSRPAPSAGRHPQAHILPTAHTTKSQPRRLVHPWWSQRETGFHSHWCNGIVLDEGLSAKAQAGIREITRDAEEARGERQQKAVTTPEFKGPWGRLGGEQCSWSWVRIAAMDVGGPGVIMQDL